jgi:hypothetical protein
MGDAAVALGGQEEHLLCADHGPRSGPRARWYDGARVDARPLQIGFRLWSQSAPSGGAPSPTTRRQDPPAYPPRLRKPQDLASRNASRCRPCPSPGLPRRAHLPLQPPTDADGGVPDPTWPWKPAPADYLQALVSGGAKRISRKAVDPPFRSVSTPWCLNNLRTACRLTSVTRPFDEGREPCGEPRLELKHPPRQ